MFRIDLRDYNWTAALWNRLLAAYPYAVVTRDAETIIRLSGARLPYVRADWFVAAASLPEHQIFRGKLPSNCVVHCGRGPAAGTYFSAGSVTRSTTLQVERWTAPHLVRMSK